MTCDPVALFAWISLVTLHALASYSVYDGHTYPRFVKSASNAYSLRFPHGVGLLPLPLLERAFPLGYLQLLLPLNKR
jgi:hypothetical protein